MKCRYDFKQKCLKMKIKWVPMHDLSFFFWIRSQFNKHILARSNFLLLQNSPNQNGSSKMSIFIMVYHKYDLYQLYITKFFCFHIPLLSTVFFINLPINYRRCCCQWRMWSIPGFLFYTFTPRAWSTSWPFASFAFVRSWPWPSRSTSRPASRSPWSWPWPP